MTALTEHQFQELKESLKQRYASLRADILEVLARTEEYPYSELAGTPELGDASVADLLIDLDNAMVHRDVQEIREIEGAMERMDGGNYGNCIDCGLPIDYERLLVFPAAKRCLPCQEQYERTHVHDTTPSL